MKPETVFVQIPPDMPLFMKNQKRKNGEASGDYKDVWYQFLKKARDQAFLISPKPKFASDIVMNSDKLKKLFEENLMTANDEFELGTNTIYTKGSKCPTL